jgi:aspartate 1-decarboxylase
MYRTILKSKIHRATVTEANLQYEGSVTIDEDLMKAADILPGEKVQVVNLNNGSRIETYCLQGRPGSGTICMNGGAARWAHAGDTVIILAYGLADDKETRTLQPSIVFVDQANRIRTREPIGIE